MTCRHMTLHAAKSGENTVMPRLLMLVYEQNTAAHMCMSDGLYYIYKVFTMEAMMEMKSIPKPPASDAL